MKHLTSPQSRLYMVEKQFPGTSLNNIGVLHHTTITNRDELTNIVESAFGDIVDLRTRITLENGKPCTYIADEEIVVDQLTCQNNKEVRDFCQVKTEEPFQLHDNRLYSFTVMNEEDGTFSVMLVIHHIICDGSSWSLILNRLEEAVEGKDFILEFEPYNMLEREEKFTESKRFESSRQFWEEKILNIKNSNKLFNTANTLAAKRTRVAFPEDVFENTKAYFKENKIMEAIGFLGIHVLAIAGFTNQKNITTGMLFGNRVSKSEKKSVGMFVSTLPLTETVDKDADVADFIKSLATELNGVMRNQQFPLQEIIKMTKTHDIDLLSKMQTIFNYEAFEVPEVDEFYNGENYYPMIVRLANRGYNFLEFEYQTDVFSEEETKQFAEYFFEVCKSIIGAEKVGDVKICNEDHIKQVTTSRTEDFGNKTVIEMLDETAKKFPNNRAMFEDGREVSYRKFQQLSNTFAHYLVDEVGTEEAPIAIVMNRCIELYVTIFGIVRAGLHYVPVSPTDPVERKMQVIKESGAKLVVTSDDFTDLSFGVNTININNFCLNDSEETLINLSTPERLAYIIYTSGSTGKPKGVMVENKNVTALINWMETERPLSEKDVLIQKTTYSFDISISEIFRWQFSGASLYIPKQGVEKNPEMLVEAIYNSKATQLYFVPSALNILLTHTKNNHCSEKLASLNNVLCAGEALLGSHVELFNELLAENDTVLSCYYGPTETTVYCSGFDLEATDSFKSVVPLGPAAINATMAVIDENNNLLPPFVNGEIVVAGDFVTRGYKDNEKLTNEKYIVHSKLGRVYKTGDTGFADTKGVFHFTGRVDNQVKIRGNRIEIDEIEDTITKLESVKQAAVIVKEADSGKYLAAFVVGSTDEYAIRQHVKDLLPSYMIPKTVSFIGEMPYNNSGKIDRKKLSTMEVVKAEVKTKTVAVDTKSYLSKIWCEVLEVETVGLDQQFELLGGDSLNTVYMHSLISDKYDIELNELFKLNTINKLAARLDEIGVKKETVYSLDIVSKINAHYKDTWEIVEDYANYVQRDVNLVDTVEYKNILVTGGSGFLGCHIVNEIIKNTKSNIGVLVRGYEGQNRFYKSVEHYFGLSWFRGAFDRITFVNGDLSEENLGMDFDKYNFDCIIHSGAIVKHFGNEEDFTRINVEGTKHVVELAKHNDAKLLYVSTMSVGLNEMSGGMTLFTEDWRPADVKIDNLYIKSKIEAEKIAFNYSNTKVVRVGTVVGHSESGVFQKNIEENSFYRLLKGLSEYNKYPELESNCCDLTYVDQAADAIVKLMGVETDLGCFHIYNHNVVSITDVAKNIPNMGMRLKIDEFVERVMSDTNKAVTSNILNNFLIMKHPEVMKIKSCSTVTSKLLEKVGFTWKDASDESISRLYKDRRVLEFLG